MTKYTDDAEEPASGNEPASDATDHAAGAAVDSTSQPDADGLHETPQPDSWFAAADTAGNAPRGDLWGASSETDDEEDWGDDKEEDDDWGDDEEEPQSKPKSGHGLFGRRKAEPDDADADESEEEDWDDEGADDDWGDPDDAEEEPAEPAKRRGLLGFLGGRKAKPQSGEEANHDDTSGDSDDDPDDEGWDDPNGGEDWGSPDGTGDSDGWTDDGDSDGYGSLAELSDSAGEGVRIPWKPIVIGVVSIALMAGVGFGVHAKMRADAEAERDAACKALAASWNDWRSAAKEADDLKIEHSKDIEQPCPVDAAAARAGAKNLDDKTAGLRSEIAKTKALAEAKESAKKALEANPKATQGTKDALNKALEGDDANEILKLSAKLPEEQKQAEEAEKKAAEEKAKADAEAAKKAQEEAQRQAEAQAQAQAQAQQQQQQQQTPRKRYVAPKRPAYTPQPQPQQPQPQQGGDSSTGSMGGSIG